jgi:hypothetical protein
MTPKDKIPDSSVLSSSRKKTSTTWKNKMTYGAAECKNKPTAKDDFLNFFPPARIFPSTIKKGPSAGDPASDLLTFRSHRTTGKRERETETSAHETSRL